MFLRTERLTKKIELAVSDQSYWGSWTVNVGTIRIRHVAPENFSTWTNTSSLLGWVILPDSGHPTMEGTNNNVAGPIGNGPFDEYWVF